MTRQVLKEEISELGYKLSHNYNLSTEEIDIISRSLYEKAILLRFCSYYSKSENKLVSEFISENVLELRKKIQSYIKNQLKPSIDTSQIPDWVFNKTIEIAKSEGVYLDVFKVLENDPIIEEALQEIDQEQIPDETFIEPLSNHHRTTLKEASLNSCGKTNEQESEEQKLEQEEKLSSLKFEIENKDRLNFIKHLFGGNVENYAESLYQITKLKNKQSILNYITEDIKPRYNNWHLKEEFANRFIEVILRNFEY